MSELEGEITVVMPTGKRMDAIASLADAIAYNAEAAKHLARVIENLEAPKAHFENFQINTSNMPAIVVKTDETNLEEGVYLFEGVEGLEGIRGSNHPLKQPDRVRGIYKGRK